MLLQASYPQQPGNKIHGIILKENDLSARINNNLYLFVHRKTSFD
jgi:hypothetical protein